MSKDLYDIVADKVLDFCQKTKYIRNFRICHTDEALIHEPDSEATMDKEKENDRSNQSKFYKNT